MKKGTYIYFILFLVLLIGLSLLLYPTVSDYVNSLNQSRAITSYVDEVAKMDENKYQMTWDQAIEYNRNLLTRKNNFILTPELEEQYYELLDVAGTGIMGYVEIPSINCTLPIYHGVDETVLQIAVGHIEWTSLPIGGESTHAVLSGHRGLPSAKLFTNLDQLREGDLFMLRVLDELLTYGVEQILIVEPEDVDALTVEKGEDLCTLVTCTPYGVNSHRMLVRGHRVENTPTTVTVRITADAIQIEPIIVALFIGLPLLLIAFVILFTRSGRRR